MAPEVKGRLKVLVLRKTFGRTSVYVCVCWGGGGGGGGIYMEL